MSKNIPTNNEINIEQEIWLQADIVEELSELLTQRMDALERMIQELQLYITDEEDWQLDE